MHGQEEYLESQVMTASPYRLHLMVVDAAIRHAVRAEQAMAEDDIEAVHFALNDSRGFIGELISGLNEEQAPELVGRLKGMFLFVFRNLVDADLNRDVVKIRDALKILKLHRETWLAVADQLDKAQHGDTPADTPPPPHMLQSSPIDNAGRSWAS